MEEKAMRFFNLLGNKFFSLAFSWLLGQPIKDTLCGTKVLRRDAYLAHRGEPRLLRRLRSLRRFRPAVRRREARPRDRRAADPLPRTHLRHNQHPALACTAGCSSRCASLRQGGSSSCDAARAASVSAAFHDPAVSGSTEPGALVEDLGRHVGRTVSTAQRRSARLPLAAQARDHGRGPRPARSAGAARHGGRRHRCQRRSVPPTCSRDVSESAASSTRSNRIRPCSRRSRRTAGPTASPTFGSTMLRLALRTIR